MRKKKWSTKPLDLTGCKFGRLTIISLAKPKKYLGGRLSRSWNARCDCGNTTTATVGHLRSGHTTSCGCYQGCFKHGLASKKGVTKEYRLWNGAKSNARRKGIPCTITPFDIHVPDTCPLLGIKLDKNAALRSDTLPSLDRIDSTRGYTPENIWVISWKANKLKSNATLKELKQIVENWEHAIIDKTIQETR